MMYVRLASLSSATCIYYWANLYPLEHLFLADHLTGQEDVGLQDGKVSNRETALAKSFFFDRILAMDHLQDTTVHQYIIYNILADVLCRSDLEDFCCLHSASTFNLLYYRKLDEGVGVGKQLLLPRR